MPIRPENMKLYPGGSIRSPEWLALREQVRERAGNKCEQCGVANGAIGYRGWANGWIETPHLKPGDMSELVWHRGPRRYKVIKIVCTTAHVDGQLVDHSLGNLRFLCQRCHNRHDAAARAAGVKARRG